MVCHGNHDISYYQNAFIFEDNIFQHLSGPIEQIHIQKKKSWVFNVGLITSWDAGSSNGFSLIFKFPLIFMNMQMI